MAYTHSEALFVGVLQLSNIYGGGEQQAVMAMLCLLRFYILISKRGLVMRYFSDALFCVVLRSSNT